MQSMFNIYLCVEYSLLTYGIIATFPCCTGMMFVYGALAVMRWSPDLVSATTLLCEFCVEEVGDPVLYTISKFGWVNFVLLITVVLLAPSYQRPRVDLWPIFSCCINVYKPLSGLSFATVLTISV